VAAVILSLLYAREQSGLAAARKLYADDQTRNAARQAEAAARYKAALSESDRRLAMLNLERGRIAFEKGQIGAGWRGERLPAEATMVPQHLALIHGPACGRAWA
jgi:hypothetical protein